MNEQVKREITVENANFILKTHTDKTKEDSCVNYWLPVFYRLKDVFIVIEECGGANVSGELDGKVCFFDYEIGDEASEILLND